MSETATEDGDDGGIEFDPAVLEDRDEWEALDRAEQSAILDEGLDRLKGESGEGHWRHLSATKQRETVRAIEQRRALAARDPETLSPAEAAMQDALGGTWTAELWADDESRPTIPFEVRELEEAEQDVMQDGFRMLASIQAAADREADADADDPADVDLEIEDIEHDSEFFDSVAAFERWFFAFLADVTVAEEFDEQRFRTGTGLIAGTRGELMGTIFFRYQEAAENARKFRGES